MRVLWAAILLLSVAASAVRVLRDPEALEFFGIAIVVMAAVLGVGSLAALILTAVRRLSTR
jgi:hypothetical protein